MQSRGYECYILQPSEMDPKVCAGRNVHGRKLEELSVLAEQWEPTPPLYTRLNPVSLFPGADETEDITEVDMDTDHEDLDRSLQGVSTTRTSPPDNASLGGKSAHEADEGGQGKHWSDSEEEEEGEGRRKGRKRMSFELEGESEGEESHAMASLGLSRWEMDSKYDEEKASADGRKKKKSGTHGRTPAEPSASTNGSKVSSGKKRVRWVDEEAEREASKGFCIASGAKKARPLEEIYVLTGLGPPKEEVEDNAAASYGYSAHPHLSEGRFGLVEHHAHQPTPSIVPQ